MNQTQTFHSHACNVRDFGATGDGRTKDTAAVQAAIDHSARQGGGRVLLPAGTYLCGTLFLKDDIDLHLSAGAVLRGSPDRDDYPPQDDLPESSSSIAENTANAHLLVAYRRRNVSITGPGCIDGNSPAFYDGLTDTDHLPYRYKIRPVVRDTIPWRPSQMLWFCRCRNVSLRDVTLRNAPYWTCLLLGCEDVRIRGLRSLNPPTTWNGDGLDIDCCRNVTISDCLIRSGDDCLTLRANNRRLGEDATPCENVVVSNCVFSSPTCGIRIGVGNGEIRRCRFSNVVVTDTRTGICIMSRYSDSETSPNGVRITDIRFSDFTLDCLLPFHIVPSSNKAKAIPPAGIEDIGFERFTIRSSSAARIIGDPDLPIRNLTMRGVQWRVGPAAPLPACFHGALGPTFQTECVLLAEHLRNCRFEDIELLREPGTTGFSEGLRFSQSTGLHLRDIDAPSVQDGGFAPAYVVIEDRL